MISEYKINGVIYDIECLKLMFYYCDYNIITNKWVSFEISKYQNDLDALVKYLKDNDFEYQIGYNNLSYDSQVLEFIIKNHSRWFDLTGEEIKDKIFQFSGDRIDDSNYGLFAPYREETLTNKQIDIFRIHHYDNENKRTSLKWLEFMMNWRNLEEMPYWFADDTLTREQLNEVKDYCKNDILATHLFYKYTIGEVDHEMYKGKNKIEDRLSIIAEGLLPAKAINYSDSKIGDELNKVTYCKLTNKTPNDLYKLKRERKPTKKFTFGQAIPEYVKFQTPEFQKFYNDIKKVYVSLSAKKDDQSFPVTFRGTTYSIMRGGIHSTEKCRIIKPQPDEILRDADVGSQYPNAIRKRKLYPIHLGPMWTQVGINNIEKKDYYKQLQKQEGLDPLLKSKYKGLETTYKLGLNAGYFGKTLEITNWQYGPEVGYYCTIGNQFEILMLIEMLELKGIHCVSANTDGIVCLFKKDLEQVYYDTCHEWEKIVGNDVMGKLEYTDFASLCQESINHYVAIKTDGSVKIKGRFTTEDEIHKNNTDKISRIGRKALVAYFSKGIPVEETIKNSTNIWDFCIGKKSSDNYRWEALDQKTNERDVYKKLIRFYISTDGKKLLKIKNEDSEATGPELTQYFNGSLITYFNTYTEKPIQDYKIDYQYYIDNIMEVVRKIENKRKKNSKMIEQPKEQLRLF